MTEVATSLRRKQVPDFLSIRSVAVVSLDLLPLRPVYAATSGLALIDAVLMAVAGQASRILAVVAALALVLLSAAPRLIRGGG